MEGMEGLILGRRLLVVFFFLLTLGTGSLTVWLLKQDVTVTLAEPACRAQRIANENPATRIQLIDAAAGRCRIEHVNIVEWTTDPAGYVLIESSGDNKTKFTMKLRRDGVVGFYSPGSLFAPKEK